MFGIWSYSYHVLLKIAQHANIQIGVAYDLKYSDKIRQVCFEMFYLMNLIHGVSCKVIQANNLRIGEDFYAGNEFGCGYTMSSSGKMSL